MYSYQTFEYKSKKKKENKRKKKKKYKKNNNNEETIYINKNKYRSNIIDTQEYVYIIFSKLKQGNAIIQHCTSSILQSDISHTSVFMPRYGYYYHVNIDHDGLKRVQNIVKYCPRNDSEKIYYKFAVTPSQSKNIRDKFDSFIETQLGYDKCFYYTTGVFGYCFGRTLVSNMCSSDKKLTCSKAIYNVLIEENCRVLNNRNNNGQFDYEHRNDLFPQDLLTIIQEENKIFIPSSAEEITSEKSKLIPGMNIND